MSEDPLDPALEEDDFEGAKKSGPSMVVLLLVAALGAGAGGWFGGPVVTPMIAQVAGGGDAGRGGEYGDDGGGYDDGYGGGGYEAANNGPLTIDGLVLNPAGSGASRFLIATLVLETDDQARSELQARDAEARDMLLTVLSSMTVEELTDISQRNVIRETLRSALNDMLAREGVHRIFLPQFVIQ